MTKKGLIIVFASFMTLLSYAEKPTNLSANFIGEKMWNTEKMIPYNGSVSLEIKDSLAYLKYDSTERVDTFYYDRPYNDGYRYVRQLSLGLWESMDISKDNLKLQVGEPKEVNYFYKLESINSYTICPECHGIGEVLCPRCQGTGHVTPKKNGSPEESVGICPFCHGSRSITHSPCIRCKGTGRVDVKKQKNH